MIARPWHKRLVACISVMAYFVANTHLAFTAEPSAEPASTPEHAPAQPQQPAECEETVPACKHCAARLKARAKQKSDPAASAGAQEKHTPDHDQPGRSCDTPCPCCPHEPGDPSCPCPDGCAMCSVAKAPCLAGPTCACVVLPHLGYTAVEESFTYIPPLPLELIRPPRA
jgi:hypothetical protein